MWVSVDFFKKKGAAFSPLLQGWLILLGTSILMRHRISCFFFAWIPIPPFIESTVVADFFRGKIGHESSGKSFFFQKSDENKECGQNQEWQIFR